MSATSKHQRQIRSTVVAWSVTAIVCVVGLAITRPPFRAANGFTLLLGKHAEYLPFLPLILFLPLLARRPFVLEPVRELAENLRVWARIRPTFDVSAAVGIAIVALWATSHLASQFEVVAPNYHDEFSYLFQAKTFAQGGVTADGFPKFPGLFDQMHVLSGDRMASRYFPGTGLWMLPFVMAGVPFWGHQVAHVLCAVGLYFCGRELGGRLVGVTAGLLFGLSPGLVVFSNLLLAHHPTMVGLILFLWAYLRWMRKRNRLLLIVAGTGLSYAMLCRPMTAAGFGLPFGVHFAWHLVMHRKAIAPVVRDAVAISAPLVLGFAVMAFYNAATTGDATTTPYQLYTDIHTPRHMYGFSNGVRGDAAAASAQFDQTRRMDAYDNWATNLTPAGAVENGFKRIEASLRLTLGVLPLVFVFVCWFFEARSRPVSEWLLVSSIFSLHAVHIPYWFSGIMDWHYVLESSIAWVLLAGVVTRLVFAVAVRTNSDLAAGCWAFALMLAMVLNNVTLVPYFAAESAAAAADIDITRSRYAAFFKVLAGLPRDRPAIVMVRPDEVTPHTDYVINEPGLKAQVLTARLRPEYDLEHASSLFPDRDVYLFDVAGNRFDLVRRAR